MKASGHDRPKVNSFAIELTARCNQQCRYCYNAWREDPSQKEEQIDVASILARVDRLLDTFELGHVTLTGGEPFASPALFPLLEKLTARSLPIHIISNGALINEVLAERVAEYKPGYVQVTLNGPDEELHALHTGPGQFKKVLAGVESLQRHKVRVGGCVVITHRNAGRVGAILELWRSLGVRQIAMSRFSPAGYASRFASELLPTVAQMHEALTQALPFTRQGLSLFSTMPLPPCAVETERFRGIRFGSCAIGTPQQEFALGPGGELRHCTLHRAALGGVPDILDPQVNLIDLVTSDEVVRYRHSVPDFCKGCVHASSCGGGCGAASDWAFGEGRATPDPFLWQHLDDAYGQLLGRVDDSVTGCSAEKG